MCVVIWQPEGHTVPPEYLAEGAKYNADGWGIIGERINRRGQLVTTPQHGLNMNDFVEQAAKYAGHNALFHCRKQSKGVVDIKNAHPYKIHAAGHPAVWMMHNGTLQIPTTIDPTRSDTWHLARFLENIPDLSQKLQDTTFLKTIEWMIGGGSKLAFFSEGRVKIANETAGIWKDGCWYSNHLAFPVVKYVPAGAPSVLAIASAAKAAKEHSAQEHSAGAESPASTATRTSDGVGGVCTIDAGVGGLDGSVNDTTPDGHEVETLDGTRFRYHKALGKYKKVEATISVADEDPINDEDLELDQKLELEVKEAIDTRMWAEKEPEADDIIMFVLESPEVAGLMLHRLILAGRKFALMDATQDHQFSDEESVGSTDDGSALGFMCG